MSGEQSFSAFISYSHEDNSDKDRRWASWLQAQLEEYEVPPDLAGTLNAAGHPIDKTLSPVFRDRLDLQATSDGKQAIEDALSRSSALIVLCSPRSASKPWVRKEIAAWQKLGRNARIFPVLIDGDPLRDAFPAEFDPSVVIAADFRPPGPAGQGYTDASAYREKLLNENIYSRDRIELLTSTYRDQLVSEMVRLVAGLLGIPPGILSNRDAARRAQLAEAQARRFRRTLIGVGTSAIVAVAAILYGWHVTGQNARIANEAAEKDKTITQNRLTQLEEEKRAAERVATAETKLREAGELRRREEAAAATNSVLTLMDSLLEKNRPQDALAYLADTCRRYPEASLAATRLFSLLSEQSWPMPISPPILPPPGLNSDSAAPIERARFSPDGRFIVTSRYDDVAGYAEVWSAEDFSLVAGNIPSNTVGEGSTWHPVRPDATFFSPDGRYFACAATPVEFTHRPPSLSLLDLHARHLQQPTDAPPRVSALRFGPDGRLVTGTEGGDLIHWTPDLQPGPPLHFPAGIVALSLDGETALLSRGEKFLRVPTHGDAHGAQRRFLPIQGHLIGYSPQLDMLVTVSKTGDDTPFADVSVWRQNPAPGQKAVETQRIAGSVEFALSVSERAILILASLTGSDELRERVGVVDLGSKGGKFLHAETGADPEEGFHPYDARLSADGKWLTTISPDLTARVWAADSPGDPARFVVQAVYECSSVDLSPDARRWLVADDRFGTWRLWSLDATVRGAGAGRRLHDVGAQTRLAVQGSVVVFQWPGDTVAYDLADGHAAGIPVEAETIDKQDASLPEILFNVNRSRKLVRGDQSASLCDAASGKELARGVSTLNGFARFSPDGGKVLAVSDSTRGRYVQCFDAETGRPLGAPLEADGCENAGFSAEGDCEWVCFRGPTPTLVLYDVASHRRIYGPVESHGAGWVWVAGGTIRAVAVESGPGDAARAVVYDIPYRVNHADPLMCDLAEAIASRHVAAGGAIENLPSSKETFRQLARRLPTSAAGDDPFLNWARWLLRERDSELGRRLSE